MILCEPTTDNCDHIRAYREEFILSGDSMDGTCGLESREDPAEWIAYTRLFSDPETVPEGMVPSTQLIYVREEDGKIVGMLQIRHCFNNYLERFGGHIGYCVAPSERRKGYASGMLGEALPLCGQLGLERVLITCIRGNEGSRRTILKNGGAYESTVYEPGEDVYIERYWIEIV